MVFLSLSRNFIRGSQVYATYRISKFSAKFKRKFIPRLKGMCEEDKESELISLKKVNVKGFSNFQFHAAYLAYSEAYDKATDPEVKKFLNQNIIQLQENKIDYQTFYRNINQYRSIDSSRFRYRSNIKTQSKSRWRIQMRKKEREKRYEK